MARWTVCLNSASTAGGRFRKGARRFAEATDVVIDGDGASPKDDVQPEHRGQRAVSARLVGRGRDGRACLREGHLLIEVVGGPIDRRDARVEINRLRRACGGECGQSDKPRRQHSHHRSSPRLVLLERGQLPEIHGLDHASHRLEVVDLVTSALHDEPVRRRRRSPRRACCRCSTPRSPAGRRSSPLA